MVTIELYGVPRLRAGLATVAVPAENVGEALAAPACACPALEGTVVLGTRLHAAYHLSLNGERFISEPSVFLSDGDVLILLSTDVGG